MVSDASHYQWQVKVNPGIQIPKNVIVPTGWAQIFFHDGVIPRGLRFYPSLEFLFSRSAGEWSFLFSFSRRNMVPNGVVPKEYLEFLNSDSV